MNSKIKHDTDINSKRFAGYQSNFKKLAKLISEVECQNSDALRKKILLKIDAQAAIDVIKQTPGGLKCTKHFFINELEKYVWILN